MDESLEVETLTIYGTLRWDQTKANLELRANYVLVEDGGHLVLGTVKSPMNRPATVYITDGPHSHPNLGRRFLGGMGRIEIHGRRMGRTWTLLSQTALPDEKVLYLKHDPRDMGWQVGDRIGLATTSRGESTVHRILAIAHHQLTVDEPVKHQHWGGFKEIGGKRFELAAEVVNLERSVLITGDHQNIEASNEGLHTIQAGGSGYMDMRYTRVERCGQRPVMGRYCLHFHLMKKCSRCVFQGNAVVDGEHVGITVHGTHNSLVDQNIIWDAKANGLYIEDGNELNNTLRENVAICTNLRRCAVDWVSGVAVQTAGIFMIGMTNHILENRIVGYENGIWTPGSFRGTGHGLATGRTCPQFYPFGDWRGNTCHDCNRFGLYLDHQYPRKVKIDDDGFLVDKDSCKWFTRNGEDNGVVNEIRDEVNWHNTYVGQYAIGDIQFINYTSINNGHSMYWKQGKNFVDKRPWHVLDSTFANDADDSFGVLQFLGPAGPFAFGMKNCAFIGSSPPGIAALAAGQHCGLLGGAGPCNVQYVLEDVDFSRMQAPQPRLAFGANTAASQAAVLPVFLTKDASLGGFRSIISAHLDGFRAQGCQPLNAKWAQPGALGCNGMIRRLNVWGGGARLQIEGPGYETTPDWTFPTEGRNAGEIPFDSARRGYGALVLAEQAYRLTSSWDSEMIIEFSDPVLGQYFESESSIILDAAGGQCTLKESDNRRFICDMGEFGGMCNFQTASNQHVISGGRLQCAGSTVPSPVPITTPPPMPSPVPSPTTPPSSRPAPISVPPLSGSSSGWILHVGLNCWENHGALPISGADPLDGTFTVDGCRRQCEKTLACQAAVVRSGWDDGSSPCFLRRSLLMNKCRDYADFDVWQIERVPMPTTSLPPGSSSTTASTATTSAASTTESPVEFEGVGGGVDRACRGAFPGDNSPAYYVLQHGVAGLEGCKGICMIDALCQGIEYSAGRCELWTRPGGIRASIFLRGFTCLRFLGAPTTTASPLPFVAVDGGTDRACRGRSPNDNSAKYYTLAVGKYDLNQCKEKCAVTLSCNGIEHSKHGRCELWTRSGGIQATRRVAGYTCWRFELGSGGSRWSLSEGLNCYDGHGAKALQSIAEFLPVEACKAECVQRENCEGIVVRSGWDESPCWLYASISVESCLAVPDYDFWHRAA